MRIVSLVRFNFFLSYLILIGAVLPVAYLVLVDTLLSERYFAVDLVSDGALVRGHIYTAVSVILLWVAAIRSKPKALSYGQISAHLRVYGKYEMVLFIAACLSLLISISLSTIYGMSSSNLTAQRPVFAVYAGYLARVLSVAAPAFVGYQFILFNKLSVRGWVVLFLILLDLVTAWSRSGLMTLFFLFLLCLSYAIDRPKIRWGYIFIFLFIGLVGVFAGEYLRSGNAFAIIPEIFLRFYANNQTLYLAMTDHEKIFNILMDGQPWVMFDQLFSFIIERTQMPSSFRLLEFGGGRLLWMSEVI